MNVVADVGANVGDWTASYLAAAPQAEFYCFEPAMQTFRDLSTRFKAVERVHLVRAAVGRQSGSATLFHWGDSEENSLLQPESPDLTVAGEQVEVLTLDEFAQSKRIAKIDFLKTDTEGFDNEVLLGATGLLSRKQIDFVFAEVTLSRDDRRHSSFDSVTSNLSEYEYRPIGFYNVLRLGPPWRMYYLNALYTCL